MGADQSLDALRYLIPLMPHPTFLLDNHKKILCCSTIQKLWFGVALGINEFNSNLNNLPFFKKHPEILRLWEEQIDQVYNSKIATTKEILGWDLNKKLTMQQYTLIPIIKDQIVIALFCTAYLNTLSKTALSENSFKAILASLPGHIYWKDKEGRYLGCNSLQAYDLNLNTVDDIIGKTDYDFSPKEEADHFRTIDQKVMLEGKELETEEEINIRGHPVTVLTRKIPLYTQDGDIIGILGNSLDITELKKTQNELKMALEKAEAANRVKAEFIANMGHDIRTPLTGIIGFSHYLEDHITSLEDKECAKQIYNSGEQLLGLLNDVLDMIKAESTNEDAVLAESFDLHALINDVLELELPAVQSHNLSIETHIDETIPYQLIGDKIKLHRILLNLAGNAIKFTKMGHIEINATLISQEDKTVEIKFQVKDTGIGIPDDLQDKVFDRFFKISPSYKGSSYVGNGIGLHIAQKYVELLGGELQLESKEGVGTTFFFTLKMVVANKKQTSSLIKINSKMPSSIPTLYPNQFHVLLVEDNVAALQVLKMMVTPYATHLQTADDAEKAFLLVQQHPFDLIITDIGLPKKNGDDLARDIRSFEKEHQHSPCYIVALTGHALDRITEDCLNAGINEVYCKPMTAEPLKQLIERFTLSHQNVKPQPSLERMTPVALPATDEEIFELNHHPLFDEDLAIKLLGSNDVIKDIFKNFIEQGINPDLKMMHAAHTTKDWITIGKLAHKMKAGAVYGTVRLHYALLYLELCIKNEYSENYLERLYAQLLKIIKETNTHINSWLNQDFQSSP